MNNSDITDPLFRLAVDAVDSGNITALQQLLDANPELATKRLDTATEEGYFANPYLLWFVADNPIRHEQLPVNIAEVTQVIVDAMKKKNSENVPFIIDYTLGLVATGRIPKECKVQISLMELLIKEGARVKGSVLGPIGQHNFEAARYLLDKGSDYNLATAVGFDRWDDMQRLVKNATSSELYVALVVASFFGKAEAISLLIENGADVNGSGTGKDFGGFHSHASALHQAVYSGSLDSVQLLVHAGANREATDTVYHGTPLGWAMHMQTEEVDESKKNRYKAIEAFLKQQRYNGG